MRVGIALIEGYSFSREPVHLGIGGIANAARKIEELGFDGILTSETAGHDPFFPLLVAAEHTERVSLSTGVAISFPRSPMVVAQMAWDLQRFSNGRFQLGLGTQVKGHNERRYGVPWTAPPGPRMRDYVLCLKAIFETFQNREQPRYFSGEHYKFTMLPPVFSPGPIEHPHIPVFAHPICTARYMREVMLPTVEAGAHKAGRSVSEIEIIGAPVIVTGRNAAELEAEKRLLKQRVAFYASTRTYHPVFEIHGWHELGLKLHQMSLENRWQEMTELIPDEMAEEFATIGSLDEIGPKLKERWDGILSTINLPTDLPRATPEDEKQVREIVQTLQRS